LAVNEMNFFSPDCSRLVAAGYWLLGLQHHIGTHHLVLSSYSNYSFVCWCYGQCCWHSPKSCW